MLHTVFEIHILWYLNDFKVFLSDIIGCKQYIVDRIKEYILKLLGYDKNTKLFISLTNPLLHPIDYNNGNIDLL